VPVEVESVALSENHPSVESIETTRENCFDALVEVNFLNVAGSEYVIHVNQAHD
jgi:hypothetical protein